VSPIATRIPAQHRTESTVQQIKAYIVRNRLLPGDPLPTEAELCEALGVSRTSVREAVRRLAALDIVDVRHGYGSFVGDLSLAPLVEGLGFRSALNAGDDLRTLREVVEVRMALDLAMADSLAAIMKGTVNSDLDELVATMETNAARGEPFLEADRTFHSVLALKIGNQLFAQLITAFWEIHTVVIPRLGVDTPAVLQTTAGLHRAMLEAAEAGDVVALRAATTAHYGPIQDSLARATMQRQGESAAWAA